jgi:surface-anchored protein
MNEHRKPAVARWVIASSILAGVFVGCSDSGEVAPRVEGSEAGRGGSPEGDAPTEPRAGTTGDSQAGAGAGGVSSSGGGGGGGDEPAVPVAGAGGVGGEDGVGGEAGSSSDGPRPFILDSGHIDLFDVTYDEVTAELVVRVKDDTQLYGWTTERRGPQTVTIAVDSATALLELPEGLPPEYAFLGGAGAQRFVLDEVQQDGLPWPGWSTERLLDSLPKGFELSSEPRPISLEVKVTGPGDVFTWMTGVTGLPSDRYIDTSDDAPDFIPIAASTHVHTAWAFTAPGDYYLEVTPSARTAPGPKLSGAAHRYHFYVGPSQIPVIEAPTLSLTGLANPYAVGAQVTLTAVQEPTTALSTYVWYRWQSSGSYAVVPGSTGPTASFTASDSALYAAVLLSGPRGRVVSFSTAEVVVGP